MDKLTAGQQTSIRSAQACSNNSMHHLSSTDNSVRQPNYGPNTTAKEYETQMLKMSVIFDDNQSFDENNHLEKALVNQNLIS